MWLSLCTVHVVSLFAEGFQDLGPWRPGRQSSFYSNLGFFFSPATWGLSENRLLSSLPGGVNFLCEHLPVPQGEGTAQMKYTPSVACTLILTSYTRLCSKATAVKLGRVPPLTVAVAKGAPAGRSESRVAQCFDGKPASRFRLLPHLPLCF